MDQESGGAKDETLEEHIARGGDRRSFIRKGLAVGAAAWVAPLVVESVLSPAAASGATPCSLFVYEIVNSGNGNTCTVTIQTASQCPNPSAVTGIAACPSFARIGTEAGPPAISHSAPNCASGITTTFTVSSPRAFVGSAQSGSCQNGVPVAMSAASGTSFVFSAAKNTTTLLYLLVN